MAEKQTEIFIYCLFFNFPVQIRTKKKYIYRMYNIRLYYNIYKKYKSINDYILYNVQNVHYIAMLRDDIEIYFFIKVWKKKVFILLA